MMGKMITIKKVSSKAILNTFVSVELKDLWAKIKNCIFL